MTDALDDQEGTVSTEARTITNLCFADDINDIAEEELWHGRSVPRDQADYKKH